MGMGMGMKMFGGAVPANLDGNVITLQYSLGPFSGPSFPEGLIPVAERKMGPWDLDVLSLPYLTEFIRMPGWDTLDLAAIAAAEGLNFLDWNSSNATTSENFIKTEIEKLLDYMQTDREQYMAEILFQHDHAPGYWAALMAIEPGQMKNTVILMNLAVRIGQSSSRLTNCTSNARGRPMCAPACCRRSAPPRTRHSQAVIVRKAGCSAGCWARPSHPSSRNSIGWQNALR